MSQAGTPLLSFDDVAVRYPTGTQALEAVSLVLHPGEFVAVVGPSGCGKSTLLRLAARLLAPSSGTVTRSTDNVGFVFQDPTLLPWRTVRGNVELLCELRGLPVAQRRARSAEALRRVGLAEAAHQRPATLSGGMRMRTSLARTLTLLPELYLFDEPFAAVDEITRARLGDDLQGLFVTDRFAALFVTHSVAEAVYLSSRVLVMSAHPGHIIGEVAVPAGYPRPPQWRYTAGFAELTAAVVAALGRDGEGAAAGARSSAAEVA